MKVLGRLSTWPWRKIVSRSLFGLALLATIVALLYTAERWRWRRAWQQYAFAAEKRGVQLDASNVPEQEIPDDLNAAKAPYFTSKLPTHAAEVLSELKGMRIIGSHEAGTRGDLSEAKARLIARGLINEDGLPPAESLDQLFDREFADAIQNLAKAANRPFFQTNYFKIGGVRPSNPPDLLEAFQLSAMYAEVLIANGKADPARESLATMVRLGKLIDQEPNLMTGVLKWIGMSSMIEVISSGMAQGVWDDSSLAELCELIEQIKPFETYRNACVGERQLCNGYMRQMVQEGLGRKEWRDIGPKWARPLWNLYPRGWLYRNQLMANRFFDEREHSINLEEGTIQVLDKSKWNGSKIHPIIDLIWVLIVANDNGQFSDWFADAELTTRLASTACGLERYRLLRGEYPESMEPLLQLNLIKSLPRNPSDGSPVQYRRDESNSYILTGNYPKVEGINPGHAGYQTAIRVWKPSVR